LFAVALTCRRLHAVLSGPSAYLVVVSPPASRAPSAATNANAFPDLASAVAASRPGDTIWLSPTNNPQDPPHRVDGAGVRVRHPLNIVGGGASASDTRVECCSPAAPAVLDFSAPRARLANVTLVHKGRGGCGGAAVLHRSGRLRVERCRLKGARHGVPGLSAPLVTVATVGGGDDDEGEEGGEEQNDEEAPIPTAAAATAAAAPPLLEVSETELGATGQRGQGVRALGTGEVAAVRAVFGGVGGNGDADPGFDGTVYWLEVDASRPGKRAPGAAAAAASLLAVGRELPPAPAALARPPPPPLAPHPLAPKSWRGQGPDDPLLRINALLGKRGRAVAAVGGVGGSNEEQEPQERRQQQQQRCF
jgi:hypothetical protein